MTHIHNHFSTFRKKWSENNFEDGPHNGIRIICNIFQTVQNSLTSCCEGHQRSLSFYRIGFLPLLNPLLLKTIKLMKTIIYSCRGNSVHQESHLTTKFTLDLNFVVYSFDIQRKNARRWNNDGPCWNTK